MWLVPWGCLRCKGFVALHHDLPVLQGWFCAFVDIMMFYMRSIYVDVALCIQCATSLGCYLLGALGSSGLYYSPYSQSLNSPLLEAHVRPKSRN